MVSRQDVERVAQLARSLNPDDIALEFGPWLGALSVEIAPYADLHVVDSFEWTKDHAKRVPGLVNPGGDFRSEFQKNLAERGLSASVNQSAFLDFRWTGEALALLIIDGPKKAVDLAGCLHTTVGALRPGARVLIKNALHPNYWELLALLKPLIEKKCLCFDDAPVTASSNILELVAGPSVDRAAELLQESDVPGPVALDSLEALNLVPEHPYRIATLLHQVKNGAFATAYEALSRMKPERRLRKSWEKNAPHSDVDRTASIFNEVFAIHHTAIARNLPEPIGSSADRLLRGAWVNMAGQPDRANRFQPEMLEQARLYGYIGWPNKVRALTYGKHILDVGCGPGLHGLGYLASGAASYLGVDPIIRTDRDRVKNLASGGKMEFGWTPEDIMARIDAWEVLPIGIEDLPEHRSFDLVIMHNVTEHLPDIDAAFAAVARVLRSGGHVVYNHDNFYSWNGHHCPPKKVEDFNSSDPAQFELVDWRHLDFDPPPDHYIARGLNRIRLDDLIALTKRHFAIERMEEVPSSPATGSERLTSHILASHPEFTERELLTKNLFCIARRP